MTQLLQALNWRWSKCSNTIPHPPRISRALYETHRKQELISADKKNAVWTFSRPWECHHGLSFHHWSTFSRPMMERTCAEWKSACHHFGGIVLNSSKSVLSIDILVIGTITCPILWIWVYERSRKTKYLFFRFTFYFGMIMEKNYHVFHSIVKEGDATSF